MTPTINTITLDTANYLQTLNATVVPYAPQVAQYPTVLDTANLPACLSWPADGQWYVKGGAARQSMRTWIVLCYVQALAQNDTASNAVAAMGLLDQLINLYINVNNVSQADPPPYQITIESGPDRPHSDGGLVSTFQFGGKEYMGIRLAVNVRAYW